VVGGEIYCAEGAFRAGFFVHHCRMDGSGISGAYAAYDNLLASGPFFGLCVNYVVWFALFHGCGRVIPFFLLFLFVFFFYPCYQVLWEKCFGVVSFFVQCFFFIPT
jgi:hypothetical protein